jgi:hypothetical protein
LSQIKIAAGDWPASEVGLEVLEAPLELPLLRSLLFARNEAQGGDGAALAGTSFRQSATKRA